MRFIHERANLSKLFTKQDRWGFHKVFGSFALGSYVYRYFVEYPKSGTLGFTGTMFDWVTMACHTMLSASAIIFHVPSKRIKEKPMIIYEEYRLHAIIFTLRCLSVFAVSVLFPDRAWYVMPMVVAGHHILADHVTMRHGTPGNTAVRATSESVKSDSTYNKIIAKLYSFYQFLAIGSHLVYSQHTPDLAFNALIAIQSSAFAMTLYRKKIIGGAGNIALYGSCLILSAFHIIRLLSWYTLFTIVLVFLARINIENPQLRSKYFLWSTFLQLN